MQLRATLKCEVGANSRAKRAWALMAWLWLSLLISSCSNPGDTAKGSTEGAPTVDATATTASGVIATTIADQGAPSPVSSLPTQTSPLEPVFTAALPSTLVAPPSPIVPTATLTPSPTAMLTPSPTPSPTPGPAPSLADAPTPYPQLYEHIWSVRSADTDDAGAIFVNGKMVTASIYDRPHDDTGWITINQLLRPAQQNVITFVSSNQGGNYKWQFGLRRDETAVWTSQENGKGEAAPVQYVQQLLLFPDGHFIPVDLSSTGQAAPAGKWYVRLQNIDAVAAVLVNGLPVALTKHGGDSGWVEITGNLSEAGANMIHFTLWSFGDEFTGRFHLRHDETIVWGSEQNGTKTTGLAADMTVIVDNEAAVSWDKRSASTSGEGWAVRAYNTDDLSALFVDQRLIGVAKSGGEFGDTGWISIERLITPGEDHVVTVANANTGGNYSFGYLLQRDGVHVWGVERDGGKQEGSPIQAGRVAVAADGEVTPLALEPLPVSHPGGRWFVRLSDTDDVATLLINGTPVAVVDRHDVGWVDITDYLAGEGENHLRFSVWNLRGEYSWDLAIRHDDTTIWSRKESGAGPTGLVFDEEMLITGQGDMVLSRPSTVLEGYDWAARLFNTDDVSAVFVNGAMVGAALKDGGTGDSGWIVIDSELRPEKENIIAFANGNTGGDFSSAFSLRRDGTEIWQAEDKGAGSRTPVQRVQLMRIAPDASIEVLSPQAPSSLISGSWQVRAEGRGAIVSVQVNGVPVALLQDGKDFGWIDIQQFLASGAYNTIRFSAWGVEDVFQLDLKLQANEIILWSKEAGGAGANRLVLDEQIVIDRRGQLLAPAEDENSPPPTWSVRAYNTDDVSAIFADRTLVAAAAIDDGRADSGWVSIEPMNTSQDTELVFMSGNTGGESQAAFQLRRNLIGVWGVETEGTSNETPLQAGWRVAISPAGTFSPETQPSYAERLLPGQWCVQADNIDDVAAILVNGNPVLVAGRRSRLDRVDISHLLSAEHNNVVTMAAWNFTGEYRWHFSIWHNDTIVWSTDRTGSGIIGRTVNQDVIISSLGKVHAP